MDELCSMLSVTKGMSWSLLNIWVIQKFVYAGYPEDGQTHIKQGKQWPQLAGTIETMKVRRSFQI